MANQDKYRAKGMWLLWVTLSAYTIFTFFFHRISSNIPFSQIVAVLLTLSLIGAVWMARKPLDSCIARLSELAGGVSTTRWLAACLAIGITLRVLFGILFPMDLFSDPAAYWQLARQLAVDGTFAVGGTRSYWPPGLPLFLLPAIKLLGVQSWIPLLLNVLLFVFTALVVFALAQRLLGHRSARFAVFALAIWPNLIFMSAMPHKELLVALLLPTALLLYVEARIGHGTDAKRRLLLTCSGLCLGLAALTQPSTALFGFVLLAYELVLRTPPSRAIIRVALVGLVTIATVAPWTIRNYLVHDAFIPINTAGGGNFYSANNPKAWGGWIPDSEYMDKSMREAGEIENNRLGYERGLRWIGENKIMFLKLVLYKHTRYLCCDSYGASFVFQHPRATINKDPRSWVMANWISDGFWLFLWLLMLAGTFSRKHGSVLGRPIAAVLPISIWYFLVIYGVYQSESKHHVVVAGIIATMAGLAFHCQRPAGSGGARPSS